MLKEEVTRNVDTSIDPMTAVAKGATLYAATRPLLTTDADMCDRKWDDHCVEACDLHEYEEEDYEDEDYEDEDCEDEE